VTIRVNAVVEGQTEETFVKRVLAPYLGSVGVYLIARGVETSRHHATVFRGGVLDYGRVRRDLQRWMSSDNHADCYFTTMIDLDHLPTDFPGSAEARRQSDPYLRVSLLEDALRADLNHPRFIPYIQLHEFEALVLVDPGVLGAEFDEHQPAVQRLVRLVQGFASPELIDDGPETAPSKRIIKELPEYLGRKVSAGPLILERIGLPTLRTTCKHFHSWIRKLEALSGEES